MADSKGHVFGFFTRDSKDDGVKIDKTDLQSKRAVQKTKSTGVPTKGFWGSDRYARQTLDSSKWMGNQYLLLKDPLASEREAAMPSLSTTPPLNLASTYVDNSISKDSNTPILSEVMTEYAIDNYNFQPMSGLAAFSRFEKTNIISLPDRILEEYNSADSITNMGILKEIKRCWITIDNKLILWNYNAEDQFNLGPTDYLTIDQFKHTILTAALVKPKPGVFVDTVSWLLLVSTSTDIHILAVQNSTSFEIFDTGMSVSTHGMAVNKFVFYEPTHDIFFSGVGEGTNVWKLSYSNTEEWFHRKCTKECVTRNNISAVVPSGGNGFLQMIPGLSLLASSSSTTADPKLPPVNPKQETIVQMEIDQTRGILYTLSSHSIIRASRIKVRQSDKSVTLSRAVVKNPFSLHRDLSTTTVNVNSPLVAPKTLKIVRLEAVTNQESSHLFLVVITSSGCRIYINGGLSMDDGITLFARHLKFPPPERSFYESLEGQLDQSDQAGALSRQLPKQVHASPAELKKVQESSKLLQNLKLCHIVSPGIFFGVIPDGPRKTDRLFVSTPDFGALKNSSIFVEDFEFLDTSASAIYDIVQLSAGLNATTTPVGYSNVFASQYTKPPLDIAILANSGIHIYRYRTPDMILEESLDEITFNEFGLRFGTSEACSTALYLACKYGKIDIAKNKAAQLFVTGGKRANLKTQSPIPTVDNVELSDRFYGLLLLMSRLFRDFWSNEVFKLDPRVKFGKDGYILEASLKELKDEPMLTGVTMAKADIEFLLCSLLIIIQFLEDHSKVIAGLSAPGSHDLRARSKDQEICLQAEHIGLNALVKLLNTVKEGFSFLLILLDDDEQSSSFKDTMGFVSLQFQADLSCLTFKDFFVPDDSYVQQLTKEILTSIINKSINRGNSVDFVANVLQERCGSFCSTGDVLIFKAIESLKKATEANNKDEDSKFKYLHSAVKLMEGTSESLNLEIISEAVGVMLQLGFYSGAIEFLLNVVNNSDSAKLAYKYIADGNMLKDDPKKKAYEKRVSIYELVFKVLVDVDERTVESIQKVSLTGDLISEGAFVDENGKIVSRFTQLRDESYRTCFEYPDKLFHFELYKWFVSQGVGEKLLDVDTPYVLPFLEENSKKGIQMAKLLWLYHAKKQNYFAAAQILYDLSLSTFEIDLANRIQFLSRANGFCNCVCPPNLRQEMNQLSSQTTDLITVANVQDELLSTILKDPRIGTDAKERAVEDLNGNILGISELYNEFVEPLGYYELALIVFKVSDHRNSEHILTQWESLFNKWQVEYNSSDSNKGEPFYVYLANNFIATGSLVSDSELLFPIAELSKICCKVMLSSEAEGDRAPVGQLIDMFLKCGTSYEQLYYILKGVIESNSYEIYPGYTKHLKGEMVHLIKTWYKNDKRLRDIISNELIRSLSEYSVEADPINRYIKATGIPI
ncbi:unnamed protein product [Kuraishia capsulata CBS 1993]|uniref:Nucleoporin Nup133/Nup155-like N-terminal domain-containing protein n=1 Tax=Kuraishia capsulata CBS 1993 TaxID=1382522 RepID=W6MQ74_9ASCO|nr:uncharacterized protein KUCA_T00004466001 [Kuraishia capsulata CBS 1993]CDK28483.1 unnamed protein product [Kuraishia capsulata CBS 1993]